MTFILETLRLGIKNLSLHKLRSLLTALGIIFGVAAVITMVAIGEGDKQKALAEIEQLGASNIIVRSVKPPTAKISGEGQQRLQAYGLTHRDVRRIEQTVRGIKRLVPLKKVGSRITHKQYQVSGEVFGTLPQLLDVTLLAVMRGRYLTDEDLGSLDNVAVLGASVAQRLFPLQDALAGWIRVDTQIFRVVGVLGTVGLAGGAGSVLVGRDLNFDVHIPLSTAKAQFGDLIIERSPGSFSAKQVEISEVYIQVQRQADVHAVADQLRLLLKDGHQVQGDVTMHVPLELLEQAERSKQRYNILLAAIASISLLVGGIGIMNIMLASVTERTREIGIRRAVGATRRHIAAQFLVETTVLSGLGGVLGVALGLGAVLVIPLLSSQTEPRVTNWSVMLSVAVAVGVGIVFGFYPALHAAKQDPIVALRHD